MVKILLDGVLLTEGDIDVIELHSAPVVIEPPDPLPVLMIDWGADAPPDGAVLKGEVSFSFTGSLLANAELVKTGAYDPKYGTVILTQKGGGVVLDTTKLSDGQYDIELVGYNAPKGMPAAVVRAGGRKWTVRNSVIVAPGEGTIITADMATPPLAISGPPVGWVMTEDEDWSGYAMGPVAAFNPAKFQPRFSHGADTLNGSAEDQLYVTPRVKAAGITYNPFAVVESGHKDFPRALAIMPKKADAAELAIMGKFGDGNEKYLSGVLSSLHEQVYGYYEAWHKCPNFLGSWAADWLMGPSWLPEFDIMECLTKPHGTTKFWSAIHYADQSKPGSVTGVGADGVVGVQTDQWFLLAGVWTPRFLAVYANGKRVWWAPNPVKTATVEGLHDPAHRVINLALGGSPDSWAGPTGGAVAPYYTGRMRTFKMN